MAKDLTNEDRLYVDHLLFGVVFSTFGVESLEIDEYIKDTITAFKKNKTQIVLNSRNLCRYNDTEMTERIMHKMEKYKYDTMKKIDGCSFVDSTNLFRADIFKIFGNLKSMILITTGGYGYYQYVFSLIYLLSIICESSTLTKIEIKARRYGSNRGKEGVNSWLSCLWSSSSKYLIEKYKERNLSIQLMETKRTFGYEYEEYLEETILICRD